MNHVVNRFFLILLVSSCNYNDKTKEKKESLVVDSVIVEKVDTLLTREDLTLLNQLDFNKYSNLRSFDPEWQKSKMTHVWKEDTMLTEDFTPDKKFYESYGKYIKYSPDKTMFIDLDSYNIQITKDENGHLIGMPLGPDVQVSLVDVSKRKKIRLLFFGPGNYIEDAQWLDNENIVILGSRDLNNESGKKIVVWKFHLPTRTFFEFDLYKRIPRQLLNDWRNERLKELMSN